MASSFEFFKTRLLFPVNITMALCIIFIRPSTPMLADTFTYGSQNLANSLIVWLISLLNFPPLTSTRHNTDFGGSFMITFLTRYVMSVNSSFDEVAISM